MAAAVVLLVHGCLSRLIVSSFAVCSLALHRVFARSEVVVVMPVLLLVGIVRVAPVWYVLTVRRPPPILGRKVATIGTTAGKSFQIWYDTPWLALESALQAQPIIWYFAAPFGRPLSFACSIHMYTPVGGKAPSDLLGASPCSPWEPQGAAPAERFGARVRVCLPVVCRIVPCLAGYVAGVSVPQCGVWRLGWLGSCFGARAFRPAQRAGFGVTLLCSTARVGGLTGPMWRAHAPLRAPGGGAGERNTGQCRSPPLAP